MRFHCMVAAAAISLGLCGIGNAAAPMLPAGGEHVARSGVTQVHSTCHQDVRTHTVGPHRHNPYNCNVIPAFDDDDDYGGGGDCHSNVQRHFVPGYGSVWHRHSSSCAIQLYPNQGGPVPGVGGCIKAGPLTICP